MVVPRFIQVHSLHSYSGVLLNRDDTGESKKMMYGDAVRTRVSSQCLKRHWRSADDPYAIENIDPDLQAVRTRDIVSLRVIQPLRESGEHSVELLDAVDGAFNLGVYGPSGVDRRSRQTLLLGRPEVEFLQAQAAAICEAHPDDPEEAAKASTVLFSARRDNPERANFRAFRENTVLPGGLTAALFGRMVTSDVAASIEASVHVAHSLTTHREESESDYFSSVDDLWNAKNEGAASSFIGDSELTSGVFYGYLVVDVPGLVSNSTGCATSEWLGADRELAATVAHNLVRLIATVSPGGKRGATAPYAYADLILIEAGNFQPRSLATAFRTEMPAGVVEAAKTLGDRLSKLDASYGSEEVRRFLSLEDVKIPGAQRLNLPDLAAWTADVVRAGEVAP